MHVREVDVHGSEVANVGDQPLRILVSQAGVTLEDSRRIYLEGQGDLVSILIRGITGVTIWVIGVINLLPKP